MGAVKVLGDRGIKGTFWRNYDLYSANSWDRVVANMYESDQAVETFKWIGPLPAISQWDGTGRKKKQLPVFEMTARHGKYELTVEFEVDDMERDKTGQILQRIGGMGTRAAALPESKLTEVIVTPGNGYDGAAYYSNHTGRGTRINNDVTDSTVVDPVAPTTAEMLRGIMTAVSRIHSALDPQGEPINQELTEFAVMYPTLYEGAISGALGDQFTSAGVSNTLQSAMAGKGGRKISITPFFNPRLATPATTGVFYVFAMGTAEKAFIWQDEVHGGGPTKFDSLLEGSTETFYSDKRVYGVKRKGVAIPGEYARAARVTFS